MLLETPKATLLCHSLVIVLKTIKIIGGQPGGVSRPGRRILARPWPIFELPPFALSTPLRAPMGMFRGSVLGEGATYDTKPI